MNCSVISSSGQVLSTGQLFIEEDEEGDLRLSYRSTNGTIISGGKIDNDGSLETASKELFREFSRSWRVTGITLMSQSLW